METRLSKSEEKLFRLIPENGEPITSKTLADRFYENEVPMNGRTVVTVMIKRIKLKSAVIAGMPLVKSTEGSGRKSIEVWVAKRPARKRAAK